MTMDLDARGGFGSSGDDRFDGTRRIFSDPISTPTTTTSRTFLKDSSPPASPDLSTDLLLGARHSERTNRNGRLTPDDRRRGKKRMVVPFNPLNRSWDDRFASKNRHRVKATSTCLGATRTRLLQALRHLGLYGEEIAARLCNERATALLLEEERLERLRVEQEVARRSEERRVARMAEEDETARQPEALPAARVREQVQSALFVEEQRAARLLKRKLTYESMSEGQQAASRLEDEVVSWLTSDEADA